MVGSSQLPQKLLPALPERGHGDGGQGRPKHFTGPFSDGSESSWSWGTSGEQCWGEGQLPCTLGARGAAKPKANQPNSEKLRLLSKETLVEHFPRELMVAHGGSAAQGSTRLSERFTAGSCSKSWDVPLAGRGDAGDAGPSVPWWDQSMELVLGSRCPGELRAGGR